MDYKMQYDKWAGSEKLRQSERQELAELAANQEELRDRFYTGLTFGTAGLRGIMGLGLNRMNAYTVRHAAWGFGDAVLEGWKRNATPEVCLCYDGRIHSREFAREIAAVLAGKGILVRMFLEPRPTPQLSYAIRHLGAAGGINVTASHNPKEYNGFKAYWSTGAQLSGEQADRVAAFMSGISPLDCEPQISFSRAAGEGKIRFLGEETDAGYIAAVLKARVGYHDRQREDPLGIVYTPLHGVGGLIMPSVFAQTQYQNIWYAAEQMKPDGTFPTVVSANPEDPASFALSLELALDKNADLIIANDPDADRIGIAARDREGRYITITGNQLGALLTHYLLEAGREAGTLPANPALVQTIVTGGLSRAVAEDRGCAVFETFTGFRYMAAKLRELEGKHQYILAYEEAYGYMMGSHVRDKDGITAALLVCDMAAWYREKGLNLCEALAQLWSAYGCHMEETVNLMLPGADGVKRIGEIMEELRGFPPKRIGGEAVERVRDYLSGTETCLRTKAVTPLDKRGSNVLHYILGDGTDFIVRPSGTEPKIKVYILGKGRDSETLGRRLDIYAAEAPGVLRIEG